MIKLEITWLQCTSTSRMVWGEICNTMNPDWWFGRTETINQLLLLNRGPLGTLVGSRLSQSTILGTLFGCVCFSSTFKLGRASTRMLLPFWTISWQVEWFNII